MKEKKHLDQFEKQKIIQQKIDDGEIVKDAYGFRVTQTFVDRIENIYVAKYTSTFARDDEHEVRGSFFVGKEKIC